MSKRGGKLVACTSDGDYKWNLMPHKGKALDNLQTCTIAIESFTIRAKGCNLETPTKEKERNTHWPPFLFCEPPLFPPRINVLAYSIFGSASNCKVKTTDTNIDNPNKPNEYLYFAGESKIPKTKIKLYIISLG